MLLGSLLAGVLLPAAVCGAVLVAAWRPWRRAGAARPDAVRGTWGDAAALAAGYVAGHAAVAGWPSYPPPEVSQWLAYLAAAAAAPAVALARGPVPAWLRWCWRALFAVTVPWLLLRPLLEHTFTAVAGVLWVSGLAAGIALLWAALDALGRRAPGATVRVSLLVAAAGASPVLLVSGSARLGQLAGVLAAVLGAGLVVSWIGPARSPAGAIPGALLVLAGLGINGYFYGETPGAAAVLAVAAPAAAWTFRLPVARRLAPWQRGLLAAAGSGLAVVAALALALSASPAGGF